MEVLQAIDDAVYKTVELKMVRELFESLVELRQDAFFKGVDYNFVRVIYDEQSALATGELYEPWMKLVSYARYTADNLFTFRLCVGEDSNEHQIFEFHAWKNARGDSKGCTKFDVMLDTSEDYSPLEAYTILLETLILSDAGAFKQIQTAMENPTYTVAKPKPALSIVK